MNRTSSGNLAIIAFVLSMTLASPLKSQDKSTQNELPAAAVDAEADELVLAQGRVADKYSKLEALLIRMAELEGSANPQRSALLIKAAKQSKERLTRNQLNTIVKLLGEQQLKRAADGQQSVQGDLKALLDLLLSENRSDRLKNEQARIREYIKEVERLIRMQRGLQGRTEGSSSTEELAKEQSSLADRTEGLAKEMQENEEPAERTDSEQNQDGNKPAEPESPDADAQKPGTGDPQNGKGEKSKSNEGEQPKSDSPQKPGAADKESDQEKPNLEKPDQKKPDGNQESETDPKPSSPTDKQPGDKSPEDNSGSKSESKQPSNSQSPMPAPGGQSEPSQQSPENQKEQRSEEFPAKKRLAAAEDRMRAAQKKLTESKRKQAAEDQEKAKEELAKAKAELEEILRQMREEEIERTLALLEGRFRRLLEAQVRIFESTKRIDKATPEQRDRDFLIQANRLSFDESRLVVEAERALQLLREDASSVAFPESVEQVRDDMQQVTDWLATAKTDKITQGIQEEIIEALEEMIAALQQAQQEAKDQKQQPQQQRPPGQPTEPSLVDQLAELKMIRALQMRVNTRTQRFSQLLTSQDDAVGQALEAELSEALIRLAERESRIHELTRDIVLGKNQ